MSLYRVWNKVTHHCIAKDIPRVHIINIFFILHFFRFNHSRQTKTIHYIYICNLSISMISIMWVNNIMKFFSMLFFSEEVICVGSISPWLIHQSEIDREKERRWGGTEAGVRATMAGQISLHSAHAQSIQTLPASPNTYLTLDIS